MSAKPLYETITLIGIGLIGSSLARVIRREGLAKRIVISTRSVGTLKRAEELDLGDEYVSDIGKSVENADLVIVSVPVGSSEAVAKAMGAAFEARGRCDRCRFHQGLPWWRRCSRIFLPGCISSRGIRLPVRKSPDRMPVSRILFQGALVHFDAAGRHGCRRNYKAWQFLGGVRLQG